MEFEAVVTPDVAQKLIGLPYSETPLEMDNYPTMNFMVAEFPSMFGFTVTDKYFTFKLMSKDCRFFDTSQGLVSKSPESRLWGERLFQHYKQQSIPIRQFLHLK
jgi:predicted transcriptional regulator